MRGEAKQTIQLAVPIIIGELAQMALHLIDSAMVGEISHIHLAATSLVLSAINIPFVFGIGMTISVSQMVSLANGKKDTQQVSHYLFNGFILCTLTAILISLTLVFGRNILYHLGQDPEVVEKALPFMKLMGISMIPMLLFMTLKQFCDGLEYTRTAMILSLISLPINIFINWLLIYGNWGFPRLELEGAGWATLITRSLIFIVLLIVVLRHPTFRKYIAVRGSQWKFKIRTIKDLLKIGVPSSLQIGMEAGAFAVTGILVGTMGAIAQASHQIAISCASFTFMVSMGLSQAGSIRVSNAFGQHNWPKITAIGKSTIYTALIYGIFCAIFFIALRWYLPTYFINENDVNRAQVMELSALLLLFAAVFQISDSTQAIGAGLLRGIKDVKIPTWLIAISYWVIGIPVGYFCAEYLEFGAAGMWFGLILGLTFSSIFLTTRFLKKTRSVEKSSLR